MTGNYCSYLLHSWHFLQPMIIFKSSRDSQIVRTELAMFVLMTNYACQKNITMDKKCMLLWVEECLSSFLHSTPPLTCIVPVLLNLYRCQMLGTSEGAPCPFLPSNCTNWGFFVTKWGTMSRNSFKVCTFTCFMYVKKCPNFPISHHLPMFRRENPNPIGCVLL